MQAIPSLSPWSNQCFSATPLFAFAARCSRLRFSRRCCAVAGAAAAVPAPSPSVAPTGSTVAEDTTTIAWSPTHLADIPVLLSLAYSLLSGDESINTDIFVASPTDTPVTSPQETIKASLFISSSPPVPAVAGTAFAYVQFQAEPSSITPAAGDTLEIAGANDITGLDPFGITAGTYIECSLYAGTQLIGSGSNIALNNGYYCNSDNHGNSSSRDAVLSATVHSRRNDLHDRVFAPQQLSLKCSLAGADRRRCTTSDRLR